MTMTMLVYLTILGMNMNSYIHKSYNMAGQPKHKITYLSIVVFFVLLNKLDNIRNWNQALLLSHPLLHDAADEMTQSEYPS
jgi:hypothetical protein